MHQDYLLLILCIFSAPFLYIFLFLFTLIGIPLLFLEMTWGQYGNFSPLQAFKAVPAMQGSSKLYRIYILKL